LHGRRRGHQHHDADGPPGLPDRRPDPAPRPAGHDRLRRRPRDVSAGGGPRPRRHGRPRRRGGRHRDDRLRRRAGGHRPGRPGRSPRRAADAGLPPDAGLRPPGPPERVARAVPGAADELARLPVRVPVLLRQPDVRSPRAAPVGGERPAGRAALPRPGLPALLLLRRQLHERPALGDGAAGADAPAASELQRPGAGGLPLGRPAPRAPGPAAAGEHAARRGRRALHRLRDRRRRDGPAVGQGLSRARASARATARRHADPPRQRLLDPRHVHPGPAAHPAGRRRHRRLRPPQRHREHPGQHPHAPARHAVHGTGPPVPAVHRLPRRLGLLRRDALRLRARPTRHRGASARGAERSPPLLRLDRLEPAAHPGPAGAAPPGLEQAHQPLGQRPHRPHHAAPVAPGDAGVPEAGPGQDRRPTPPADMGAPCRRGSRSASA